MDKYDELKQAVDRLVDTYDNYLNEEVPPEKLTQRVMEVAKLVDHLMGPEKPQDPL
tara:strand:- start:1320 stop:1487 length:168 start_codon:yes stop_codon:yes gene_type:complete